LQEAHGLIAWLSIYGAFVVVFVDANYQPGNYQKREKKKCHQTASSTVTRRPSYVQAASN
jgi:hypothetical protein